MIKGGPRTTTDGLVFYIDAADKKCIQNPGGCNGYTGSVELLNNVLSPENILSSTFNVRLGNLSYYTAIAITYPEGNYGGDAAARNGVTIGYNVRSGTKLNGGSCICGHMTMTRIRGLTLHILMDGKLLDIVMIIILGLENQL
jgi:hypothetical protein